MKYSKGLTIAGVIIGFVLLLLVVAGPILSSYLKKYIEQKSNIQVEIIQVNILFGTVKFENIKLSETILNETKISGVIKSVHINHLGLIKYLFHKDISIGNIAVSEAILSVELMPGDTSENSDMEKEFPAVTIDEFEILNSHFNASTYKKDSLKLTIDHLSIDKLQYLSSNILLDAVAFSLGEAYYQTTNGQYHIGWSKAFCTAGENTILFDSLSAIPVFEAQKFFDKEVYQTDRFSLFILEVELLTSTGDFNSANYAFKGSAILKNGHLQVTRDKNIKRKENDVKPTLQEVLKSSPLFIELDSLVIESFKISYGEIAENEKLYGIVSFDSLDAVISNLKSGKISNGNLTIDAQALFMNEGNLKAHFEFPYDKNYFDCNGSLNNLEFIRLNQVSVPLSKVNFSNGKINKLMFNFRADTDSSRGDLLFYYSNLNFAISSNSRGDTSNFKSRVLTFIADDLVVSDGNPDKNGNVSKGIIREARNRERFIFNYMWKSIFSGVKSTVLNNAVKTNKKRWKS